ncbi:sugar ABC transporter substrate-binding protein [Kineothrix sp. MB12-C1]|uniref:sugar ABC transporter substrate-binding protein n=1 Tax=Kineothrix sp. MB12-C1 TaxID=3070215 RepID=UPI0027D253DE|nr:substrate-binding domain-containing protein [Kineothrix sp. MB12-C1]WMC94305.1 substrate-binding domain-containing protein [Kineothrix sp. MB12-C1]
MRKNWIAASMLIAAILLSVIIIAFYRYGLHMGEDEKDYINTIRISAILPHKDDGYWSLVEEGYLKAEEDNKDKVDIQIYVPQLNYHVDQMVELIERQVAAKVDAIIVQGIDNNNYSNALKKAIDAGIQVVLVDTDIREFPEHLYIGTNNREAGIRMGEELVKITGGQAKVAVMSGDENYWNLEQRYEGLLEVTDQYSGIEIVRLDYDYYDALTVVKIYNEILEENPEVDTLVCIEGTAGQTFGVVFTEPLEDYRHILTFDSSIFTEAGIRNGILDGTMVQGNYQMGYRSVQEVIHYEETGSYTQNNIFTPIYWYSKEDLEDENEE